MLNDPRKRGFRFGPVVPRDATESFDKMPQATNLKIRRDMDLCPCGPGTVFNTCATISNHIRERAETVNKTEEARLAKIQKIMDKEQRFKNNVRSRVIEKTTQTLKEKQALLQLLSNEYRVDKFITMQSGFDPNTIDTRREARRYVMETRIFNSGFNMKALKPEVHRRIRKLDPNHKYRSFKKKLLASSREQNIEIDRTMADTTFYRMLHDKENWREFNLSKSRWTPLDGSRPIGGLGSVKEAELGERVSTGNDVEGAFRKTDLDLEMGAAEKEKSVVLERRLPKRPHDAFGMSMRSLGPVYFQSSVQPLPDIEKKPVGNVVAT